MDKDMLEKLIPWAAHQTEFGGIWDGSGHKMAYWAGAAIDKNETPTPMIFCFQWRSITRQVRAYWQTTIDGPGTINMNGSGDIEVKMVKADTLEELVQALELPAETTLKTIEDYNGYCERGVDEEFGKRKELLLPMKRGPFYGIKCTPWFLTTTGGVRCTEKMEVMNDSNEIIEGLYCLGSMVGDMYCNCYSTHFPGHNLGATGLTFGYLTGRQLAGAE